MASSRAPGSEALLITVLAGGTSRPLDASSRSAPDVPAAEPATALGTCGSTRWESELGFTLFDDDEDIVPDPPETSQRRTLKRLLSAIQTTTFLNENLLPPGPKDLLDAFHWPETLLDDFGPRLRDQLAYWFDQGLLIKTKYTGYAGFEIAMHAIQWALTEKFDMSIRFGCISGEACDINPSLRKVLAQYTGAVSPAHTFADICSRLPPDIQTKLALISWPSKRWVESHDRATVAQHVDELMDQVWELLNSRSDVFGPKAKSWCSNCNDMCDVEADYVQAVIPYEDVPDLCQGVRVNASGVTCLDWSQNGDQLGWAGQSTKPYLVFVAELRKRREPFFFPRVCSQ
jgi:hypothetical protein